jgi:hypothetical protein
MITEKRWVDLVIREFPAFAAHWQIYQDRWADEGSPGLCTDMSAFADFIKDRILYGNEVELKKLFDLIEHLLVFGDDGIQTAAATCCLENILNLVPRKIPPERFVPFLGPRSREFCKKWDEFTGVTTPGI